MCQNLAIFPINSYINLGGFTEILSDSGVELGENYPHPIVDLKQSRDHALSEFENSRVKMIERKILF